MSCTRVAKFFRRLLMKPCGVMPLRRAWVNENCAPLISSRGIRTDKIVDHHSRMVIVVLIGLGMMFSGMME